MTFHHTELEKLYSDRSYTLRHGEPTHEERQDYVLACAGTLRRSQFGEAAARTEIAERLENCRPRDRCNSAACLMCATAFQRWAMQALDQLWPEQTELRTYGLITAGVHRPLGQLATTKLGSIQRHVRRQFERARCADVPVVGFIDLCQSVDGDGFRPDEWAPHAHVVVPAEFARGLTQALKAALNDHRTKRPVRGNMVRHRDRQLSYVFKPRPTREIRYEAHSSKAEPTSRWLKSRELAEVLLWLGPYSPHDRLFMLNVRRYRDQLRLLPKARVSSIKNEKLGRKGLPEPDEALDSKSELRRWQHSTRAAGSLGSIVAMREQ